jgi:tetratricopeptide (TPR) repeat protein
VPPLALPRSRRQTALATSLTNEPISTNLDDIRAAEAVRLFVERARLVQPNFDVTAENADAIVEICQRLDGLPLAIELAAARARHLTPQALLARFDRRLDVLSRGQRDLPDRQRTMRDTIAWSYDLLDPAEQRVFTDLSIFVGGATLEACEDVVDAAGGDALDVLESLADKSLIRFALDEDSRITMLETIRDFARERLDASDDQSRVARRHADYFLRLAEETEPLLEGREQTRSLDSLDREQGNLRAAITWWRDQGDLESALRMSGALWRFWWLRGDMDEGRSLLEGLLPLSASVSPPVRAKALNGAGLLAESQGDGDQASRFHEESLTIAQALGDLRGVAWSLNNLGVVAINSGDFGRAEALLQENLTVAEKIGDAASIALALMDLGQVAHHQANYDLAASYFTRSLEHFRKLGDESHVARSLNNLGDVAFRRGEFDKAHALLTESLTFHRRVGDRQGIAGTLNNLAGVATAQGELETAMGLYLESHSMAAEGGNRLHAAIALENIAAITQYRNDARLAWERYREALLIFHSVGDYQGIVGCLIGLATAAIALDRIDEATRMLAAACGLAEAQLQDPCLLPGFEAARTSLSDALSEAEFEAAWQAGVTSSVDELIASLDRRPLLLAV